MSEPLVTAPSLGRWRPTAALLLLLLAGIIGGCAPKTLVPPEPSRHPDEVWQRFQERAAAQAQAGTRAFTCNASLHYEGPKTKSRVVLQFWGNLDYPLRLDLQSGLGSTLALWREDAFEFLAYLPEQRTAYVHQDGRLGMAAFGIALPFTLRELALLLNGQYASLLPDYYVAVRRTKEGLYRFTLDAPAQGFALLLDPDGAPKGLETGGNDPWTLEFSGSLEAQGLPDLPQRIRMQRQSGERAILNIKDLSLRQELWTGAALDMDLPPDTGIRLLENTGPVDDAGF